MRLWNEEGIKIPETRFNKFVRRHLLEPHLEENLPEL